MDVDFLLESLYHKLHTTSPFVIVPVIDHYLSVPPFTSPSAEEPLYTLLRRRLTALIHHCNSLDQSSPIADIAVKHVKEALAQSHVNKSGVEERLPGEPWEQASQLEEDKD